MVCYRFILALFCWFGCDSCVLVLVCVVYVVCFILLAGFGSLV